MSDDFKFQLSVKIDGIHLLNLRAGTGDEFLEQLAWAANHAEPVNAACAALGSSQKPERPVPAATPRPAPNVPQGGSGRELGPLVLENVEMKRGPKDGPPWKSPMYVVKWDGSSASTFDALIGKAAQGAWMNGNPCYLTIEPSPKNPKYQNLVSFRMAAAS